MEWLNADKEWSVIKSGVLSGDDLKKVLDALKKCKLVASLRVLELSYCIFDFNVTEMLRRGKTDGFCHWYIGAGLSEEDEHADIMDLKKMNKHLNDACLLGWIPGYHRISNFEIVEKKKHNSGLLTIIDFNFDIEVVLPKSLNDLRIDNLGSLKLVLDTIKGCESLDIKDKATYEFQMSNIGCNELPRPFVSRVYGLIRNYINIDRLSDMDIYVDLSYNARLREGESERYDQCFMMTLGKYEDS